MDTNEHEYAEQAPDLPEMRRNHCLVAGYGTARRSPFHSCRFVFIRGSTESFRLNISGIRILDLFRISIFGFRIFAMLRLLRGNPPKTD
jgi:hypothetical protein